MAFDWSVFPMDDYQKARELARQFYYTIGKIKCPALNDEYITFNAKGFCHLLHKPARTQEEKILRLSLLQYTEPIIIDPFAHIKYRQRREKLKLNKGGVRLLHDVDTQYWAFEKQIDRWFLKVVVRQIEKGPKHFFSIMGDEI